MSVRIYQLSKDIGLSNKELIELLQERGFDVKSASSTIPNIYADSIVEEFKNKPKEAPKEEVAQKEPKAKEEKAPKPQEEGPKAPPTPIGAPTEDKKAAAPKRPDMSRFIRSAEDIQKEREEKEKQKQPNVVKAPNVIKSPAPVKAPSLPQIKVPVKTPATPNASSAESSEPKSPSVPPQVTFPKMDKKSTAPAAASVSIKAPAKKTEAVEVAAGDLKPVQCKSPIMVRDFATLIEMKPFKLISKLMEMGIFASMNQAIEEDVAVKIAAKHGYKLEVQHRGDQVEQKPQPKKEAAPKIDESKLLEPRPPVVCVLGHVDHGKTTLLDSIRKANVVSGEAGGITQHIGAYQVEHNGQKITFIDTPGHAAFSKMRQRGADVTDIAILVVAADDGFKPQTKEALKFAQRAQAPVVVAINKMDSKGANLDRVKTQMQEHGIMSEDWGGETLCTPVSALKGTNIEDLLELLILQSEVMELKANPQANPEGMVMESQVEVGRGPTATVIVHRGTLKVGDTIVAGTEYCRVRAMMDDKGKNIKQAGPSTPVKLLGWSGAPEAGAKFNQVKNEKTAKREVEDLLHHQKHQAAGKPNPLAGGKSILDLLANKEEVVFRVLIKGDVHGSVEALSQSLEEIKSDKVKLEILTAEVGPVSKNDIIKAEAADAAIIGFNTKTEQGVLGLAKQKSVRVVQQNIIYELIDHVKECMVDLLEPEQEERKLGSAEIRQVFKLTKGVIAGCMVTDGRILKNAFARIHRKGEDEPIYEGKISALKRFKDDVGEVKAGYECGIQLDNYDKIKEQDRIECFEIVEIPPEL